MTKWISKLLWVAFIVAMSSSVSHVAWAFGMLEMRGNEGLGWLGAIAVDAGLASLAYSIQQRRRLGKSNGWLWLGIVIFSLISGFANLLHAMAAKSDGVVTSATFSAIDPLALAQAIILSASLPFIVLYLAEVVSSNDAAAAADAEAEQQRIADQAEAERKASADRADQERLLAEQKRLEAEALAQVERLKAEAEQTKLERERIKAEREAQRAEAERQAALVEPEHQCKYPGCGLSWPSANALRAHQRAHKNGKVAEFVDRQSE